MIKSLAILNYQSHEKTKLDFHPGVNVIVGLTDSGKSGIIRTLRWLSTGRPSGTSIQSHWGGATNVILETEEGFVRRVKDKKDTYELLINGKRNLVFQAFSTHVPQEITDFLNLSEINFQFQLDSPFLLSKTPGEVAFHFNRVARLDKIDKATSKINSIISDLNTTIGHEATKDKPATGLVKRIQDTKSNLKSFDYLEQMEAEVEVLEDMEHQYDTLLLKELALEKLVTLAVSVKARIQKQAGLLKMEPRVDALLQLYEDKRKVERDKMLLNQAISTINKVTISLKDNKARYTRLLALFQKSFPNVCPLCGSKIKHKHEKDKNNNY